MHYRYYQLNAIGATPWTSDYVNLTRDVFAWYHVRLPDKVIAWYPEALLPDEYQFLRRRNDPMLFTTVLDHKADQAGLLFRLGPDGEANDTDQGP